MRFVSARGDDDREHVVEHLSRLFFDGTGFLFSGFRVDGELSGNKKEASVRDALRIVATWRRRIVRFNPSHTAPRVVAPRGE
ncbi:MAG: hypothetical protein BMS9Abin37_1189 [Acidobacteriota bacterium]|nr:MAG: hypothetical protein BMS9Abin37_1189 [Acidobacteriota bacterium]